MANRPLDWREITEIDRKLLQKDSLQRQICTIKECVEEAQHKNVILSQRRLNMQE